jgi:putative ABC transport system permease protein
MALPLSYNVRNVVVRWKVTILAIGGIALVVAVFVVLLAMMSGFRLSLGATGSTRNAVVVQRGSNSELTSFFDREDANLIATDARVDRGPDGQSLASPEIVIVANLPRRADGHPTNVTLRGVTAKAFEVRNGVRVVEGRPFAPGLNEVIVGAKIRARIHGLDLGSRISVQKRQWEIVGVFSAEGGAFESEIWGDFDVMGPAFLRSGGQNSLTVRLADPATLADFDREVQANRQMQVQMVQERKYYADQAGPVAAALLALAVLVAVSMGIGAIFGAINTMYAVVAARTREIGTLRALGFSRLSILLGFLVESVCLALAGGLIGCLLAFPMNGFATGTGNTAGFSEIAFAFRITPADLAVGLAFALLMGVAGGLLPALRAARLAITVALREA